jgi:hypothetical protein
VALRDHARSRRLSARWLQRWLDGTPGVTIDGCALVVACLGALGGPEHEQALGALRALTQRR